MKLTPTQRALVHVHITGLLPGRIHRGTYSAALEMCDIASTIRVAPHSGYHIWQLSDKGREFMADIPGIVGADYLQAVGFVLRPYQGRHAEASYAWENRDGIRAYLYPITGDVAIYRNGLLKSSTSRYTHAELLKWRDDRAQTRDAE